MNLDSKGLGRLQRVSDPREVWAMEAGDFTPWLAENLDVLADELGLVLTGAVTEVPVGTFYLDIRAETEDGRIVIVENQLARTDHTHLGQLLVYASGLEAAVVIWLAPVFRDEHRRALDWLNERTDAGVDFFGVQLGLVRISSSGPSAPVFEVVARPNAWQKDVKGLSAATSGETTPINAARQDFFADVLAEVTSRRPAIRMPKRGRASWIAFGSGPFGFWSIGFDRDQRCQVEAYIDMSERDLNKALFDEFVLDAERWNALTGMVLDWQRLDNRRASRIAVQSTKVAHDNADQVRDWAIDATIRMYDALDATLRASAQTLRAGRGSPGGSEPAPETGT